MPPNVKNRFFCANRETGREEKPVYIFRLRFPITDNARYKPPRNLFRQGFRKELVKKPPLLENRNFLCH